MTTYPHPDCMLPDGGNGPCKGYQALALKFDQKVSADRDGVVREMSQAIENVMATRDGPEPALEDCVEAALRCYDVFMKLQK